MWALAEDWARSRCVDRRGRLATFRPSLRGPIQLCVMVKRWRGRQCAAAAALAQYLHGR